MVKVLKSVGLVVCTILFTLTVTTATVTASAADNSAGSGKSDTKKSASKKASPTTKKPQKKKPAAKTAKKTAAKPAAKPAAPAVAQAAPEQSPELNQKIGPESISGIDHNSMAKISNPFPKVAVAYGVLTDNQWLWGQKVDSPIPQASLTKLMTALLAIEHGQLDQFTVVTLNAAKAKPMKARVRAGDRIKQRDLMIATLVASTNDTCLALAEAIGGSEARFVNKMNVRAKALGLRQTHFVNACGFDAYGHQSTVRDLALLTHYVMQKKEIAEVVKLKTFKIPRVGKKAINVKSTNALLRKEGNGVIGVKTGFTNRAGRCLIAMARRNGHEVMLVMLNARNRWWNADALLNKAFTHIAQNGSKAVALTPQEQIADNTELLILGASHDTAQADEELVQSQDAGAELDSETEVETGEPAPAAAGATPRVTSPLPQR